MGWLKDCLDFALQVTQLVPFPNFPSDNDVQKPIFPPSETLHETAAGGCAGQCVTPAPFQCSYPSLEEKGWELCNTESSRDCWIRDPNASNSFSQYDVLSDYEDPDQIPPGITREYWLEVTTNETVKPDGIEKILGNYFNGTYPGPTIEACWGDQLVIHVTNKVVENGTTVHWHGIRQLNSNEMDGVNGITQCPISYEDHFTYNFTATQYGHTWYHSHYSLQYPDGVAAPLVIHGPTSANWDIDLGPMLISDWVHNTAYIAYQTEMNGGVPQTDSVLVNGKGHYQNETGGSYYQTCFTPGKKHLIRLINGAAATSFRFSIDGHNLTVISNDLVAVEPFVVDQLFIGIGQRYSVIVQAKDEADTDYWIRTIPASGCSSFSGPIEDNTAIVRYNSESTTCPTSLNTTFNNNCSDINTDLLNPILEWRIDHHPQNNVTKDTFFARQQNIPRPGGDPLLGPPGAPYVHWLLQDRPLWIDFGKPTILDVPGAIADPNYVVIEEEYDSGFVYLVLDGSQFNFPVAHPIHLHGSDFVVLAQSDEKWDPATSPSLFRYDNPPRRDVAMLPGQGFLAIAFKPDNPGAWLLHCHIAWHASSGLALQVLIRPKDMPRYLGNLKETHRVCEDWRSFNLSRKIMSEQEDSGI